MKWPHAISFLQNSKHALPLLIEAGAFAHLPEWNCQWGSRRDTGGNRRESPSRYFVGSSSTAFGATAGTDAAGAAGAGSTAIVVGTK